MYALLLRDVVSLSKAAVLVFCTLRDTTLAPTLHQLEQAGLPVVLVSEDAPGQGSSVAPQWHARGVAVPYVLDTSGELRTRYGITALPSALVLDTAGRVTLREVGAVRGPVVATAAGASFAVR